MQACTTCPAFCRWPRKSKKVDHHPKKTLMRKKKMKSDVGLMRRSLVLPTPSARILVVMVLKEVVWRQITSSTWQQRCSMAGAKTSTKGTKEVKEIKGV
jgi:hypothetical protein